MSCKVWERLPDEGGGQNSWMHHNNVPCYTLFSICQFLMGKNIPMLPQPVYSRSVIMWFLAVHLIQRNDKTGSYNTMTEDITLFPTWHAVCRWFQKKTFRDVLNSGRNNGTSVYVLKGSTTVKRVEKLNRYSIIHQTFWSSLVYDSEHTYLF